MKPYIWESSVIRTRTPQILFRKTKTASKCRSIKKPQTSKNQDSFWDTHNQPESFIFSKSRLSSRPKTRIDLNINIHTVEEVQITEQSIANLEKPGLEKYEDLKKEEKQFFVIHTYARPRRLIAIRDKQIAKEIEDNDKRVIISPAIRLGIAGWKLSRPKSLSPNMRNYRGNNQFLQVVSKKLCIE